MVPKPRLATRGRSHDIRARKVEALPSLQGPYPKSEFQTQWHTICHDLFVAHEDVRVFLMHLPHRDNKIISVRTGMIVHMHSSFLAAMWYPTPNGS